MQPRVVVEFGLLCCFPFSLENTNPFHLFSHFHEFDFILEGMTNLRMDKGRGRDTLRPMPNIQKGSSLGKDKNPTYPSKPNASSTPGPGQGQGIRRHSLGSTLPNKSTKSQTTDGSNAIKNVKKTATQSQPQRPDPLRKSAASPAPAQKKPLGSPGPQKPTTTTRSASFPSKPATSSPKPTLEKVAKTQIASKLPTLSSSSRTKTKSMKAAPSPRPSSKRGTTTSSASKKPPHDIKQVKKLETNHENLDHQVEEVVKDVQGEMDDVQVPKAEEKTQLHDQVEEEQEDPQTEETRDKFHEQEPDASNSNHEHEEAKESDSEEEINVSCNELEKVTHKETKIETEDKGEEEEEESSTTEEMAVTEESEEENNYGGKESVEKTVQEEANVVSQSQAEADAANGEKEMIEEEENLVPESQVETEASDGEKEIVEEEANLVPESREETEASDGEKKTVEENANLVTESQVELEAEASKEKKSVDEDAVTVPKSQVQAEASAQEEEETNMVPESRVQHEEEEKVGDKPTSVSESRVEAKAVNGKNEPATPHRDVVELTASNLVLERKGRVRALVGAFESKF